MKEHFIISILSENRSGIVSQITGILNRKQLDMESISAAKTDVSSVVVITIELFIQNSMLRHVVSKIANIIEVIMVDAVPIGKIVNHRVAFFKLSKSIFATPQAISLSLFGASIVNIYPDSIVISKSGSDMDIQSVFYQLDGPHLISFIKSGLIVDMALVYDDDGRVIERAA